MYFYDWTWFTLINGTKTFIGLIDVELKSIESQLNTIYTELRSSRRRWRRS